MMGEFLTPKEAAILEEKQRKSFDSLTGRRFSAAKRENPFADYGVALDEAFGMVAEIARKNGEKLLISHRYHGTD